MNKIKVELLHYTPLNVLLEALKKPYKLEESNLSLATKVIKLFKHESVAEHIYMAFNVNGVSRLELQEHMRHRISSTTCESTRFTMQKLLNQFEDGDDIAHSPEDFVDEHFVIPEYDERKFKCKDDYDTMIYYLRIFYQHCLTTMKYIQKETPSDYLKYFLVEGYRADFTWTINLRSLKNFLELRDAEGVHFEIRHVAQLIKNELKNTYIEKLI